jgi:hypothetical protein
MVGRILRRAERHVWGTIERPGPYSDPIPAIVSIVSLDTGDLPAMIHPTNH